MKIIFLLPAGVIEWPIPEAAQKDFSFQIFCGNVRINGYFQVDNIHLQYDKMVGMLYQGDAPAPEFKTGGVTGTLQ